MLVSEAFDQMDETTKNWAKPKMGESWMYRGQNVLFIEKAGSRWKVYHEGHPTHKRDGEFVDSSDFVVRTPEGMTDGQIESLVILYIECVLERVRNDHQYGFELIRDQLAFRMDVEEMLEVLHEDRPEATRQIPVGVVR